MKILGCRQLLAAAALLSGCSALFLCHADEVAFDDFEDAVLGPFDIANTGIGDGTDWTNVIPGWTITFDAAHEPTDADAYNGWTAMDVDSWILEQGIQDGRDRMRLGGDNNTALVADPDAWDDYPPPAKGDQGYNSYISHTYDITGRDAGSLELSFDWDFVCEDSQIGIVDVSFDGGATFQNLITVASIDWAADATYGPFSHANGVVFSTNPLTYTVDPTQGTFASGADFTVPGGATSMLVRFGCILAGNDWWFSVDNVMLEDSGGVIEFEDFEGLTLLSFTDGGVGDPPGDGTDYTQSIADWKIINDGPADMPTKLMYNESLEGAFNGWSAIDAVSWFNEQGGQDRDTLLGSGPPSFPANNTILLADPDAHDDYDPSPDLVTPPAGEKEFNSFICRQYNMSGFQNTTVVVEFDWEFRTESTERGLVQVSFDYGATWTTILNIDSDDQPSLDALAAFSFGSLDLYGSYAGPTQFEFGPPSDGTKIPAKNSNVMLLRFGCIDSQNNWWFAVDNVRITADAQAFAMGDANGDGVSNNLDIGGIILALSDKAAFDAGSAVPADQLFDFNADGVFNNLDIGGILSELSNEP